MRTAESVAEFSVLKIMGRDFSERLTSFSLFTCKQRATDKLAAYLEAFARFSNATLEQVITTSYLKNMSL